MWTSSRLVCACIASSVTFWLAWLPVVGCGWAQARMGLWKKMKCMWLSQERVTTGSRRNLKLSWVSELKRFNTKHVLNSQQTRSNSKFSVMKRRYPWLRFETIVCYEIRQFLWYIQYIQNFLLFRKHQGLITENRDLIFSYCCSSAHVRFTPLWTPLC